MGPGGPGVLTTAQLKELEALVALRLLPRVGDLIATRLLERFGSARTALDAPAEEFGKAGGSAALGARTTGGAEARRTAREVLGRAARAGMTVLGRGLPGYPGSLLHLTDPPPVVFVQGRTDLLEGERVAVVGARRATGAGRRFARELGRTLALNGVPVVSGLALGIDAAAHRGALEGPGSTIAVLASGLDRVHPRSHRGLQERIREEGLLVSEFPPGEAARPYHFPRRNRILAALALDVVVVEAGTRSGALITVEHALDLGREVWAVPGSVEYDQARGVNALIREGAHVLTTPEDLVRSRVERGVPLPGAPAPDEPSPGCDGVRVVDPLGLVPVLRSRPLSTDELTRRAGLSAVQILQALSELEFQGAVVRDQEGWRLPRARVGESSVLDRVTERMASLPQPRRRAPEPAPTRSTAGGESGT